MKKLVFAAQVFGLIAMFPTMAILTLNHGTEPSSGTPSTPAAKHKTEAINICLPQNDKDNGRSEGCPVGPETFLLIKAS